MDITITDVVDETPEGLTTGFRLTLKCLTTDKQAFKLDLPILVGKDVVNEMIPLPNLAIEYLKHNGLEQHPNFFIDSRTMKLENLSKEEPALPLTIELGSIEELNQNAVKQLV